MAVNPDIRDHAYNFFIEEVPEFLQVIETELLTLRQERSNSKIHSLMRTSHSLKGGAAGVGLEAIATLAHRLENIFKALYSDTIEIDTGLESQLLSAYDCLRLPLIQQMASGQFDAEQAFAAAEPIFAQLEERLEDAFAQMENFDIPTSAQLGVDMTMSIFEVDVGHGLEQLAAVVADPQSYQVAGELRKQAEVFVELAEILNKPGLGIIAEAALTALNVHPEQALKITQLALADFQTYREAVLAGNATPDGNLSAALWELAQADFAGVPREQELLRQNWNEDVLHPINQQEEFGVDDSLVESDSLEEAIAELEHFAFSPEDSDDNLAEADQPLLPILLDGELADEEIGVSESEVEELASWEELLLDAAASVESDTSASNSLIRLTSTLKELQHQQQTKATATNTAETIVDVTAQAIETSSIENITNLPPQLLPETKPLQPSSTPIHQDNIPVTPAVTVRVDADRLERMNNLVSESAIRRSGLSLENRQLQSSVQELLNRADAIEHIVEQLRKVSDQTLVPDRSYSYQTVPDSVGQLRELATTQAEFDALEMDSYGTLHSLLQRFLEDMVQLKESVADIGLFAKQSDRTLDQLRKMLTNLQDEFVWARMLPLGEVLNRFPRILRDLSITYHKPASLKLRGTEVLVDKAVLEKIYDPLLHLLRNAFDHGIELPELRRQQGKSDQGEIEIKAYHQGGQTIIEVTDDGQGLNLEAIGRRALERGFISPEQLLNVSENQLCDLIFLPGFSTAKQVNELSGRGVGLDVVRSQLQLLKGTISMTSKPGVGTTFTIRLPLTLTSAKLIVGLVGSKALAFPSDSIEEIVLPKPNQIQRNQSQRFLPWRGQFVPIYRAADLLDYAYPVPETPLGQALVIESSSTDLIPPLLVFNRGQQVFALEVDHLVTEQKLVIKPFGGVVAPPSYTYGCTILGDGSLIPVIDAVTLVEQSLGQEFQATAITSETGQSAIATLSESEQSLEFDRDRTIAAHTHSSVSHTLASLNWATSPTVLVVDDAASLRKTLAMSLERAGYRVLQAGDGWEALKQLQSNAEVNLVISDIEMPNLNGFDFLTHRRQDPQLQQVPVVMLTSRNNDKHRRLAMHLGATAYFTKPYIEQSFLNAIKDLLN
ncbi:hybrid sensor histidine kinase/response regulator [Allocoleopsis sp.]|uniref:hybrid sensor histidine kinase/response regulator n=1 Tax=Allocoleopsis sp. TaxID=3088169 RepID=UPI002FD520DE